MNKQINNALKRIEDFKEHLRNSGFTPITEEDKAAYKLPSDSLIKHCQSMDMVWNADFPQDIMVQFTFCDGEGNRTKTYYVIGYAVYPKKDFTSIAAKLNAAVRRATSLSRDKSITSIEWELYKLLDSDGITLHKVRKIQSSSIVEK